MGTISRACSLVFTEIIQVRDNALFFSRSARGRRAGHSQSVRLENLIKLTYGCKLSRYRQGCQVGPGARRGCGAGGPGGAGGRERPK